MSICCLYWYISEKFFEKFRLKLRYVFQHFYSAFSCFCFFFFALSYFTYASALILIWFLAINSLETGPMDSTGWTSIGNSPAVAEVSRMINWISFASWRYESYILLFIFSATRRNKIYFTSHGRNWAMHIEKIDFCWQRL